jgi:hypothetical protein
MPFYGAAFGPHLVLLTLSLLAFVVGMWFSILNVRYCDVRSPVPLHARLVMDTTLMGFLWQMGGGDQVPPPVQYQPAPGGGGRLPVAQFEGPRYGERVGFAPRWGTHRAAPRTGLEYFRQLDKNFPDLV